MASFQPLLGEFGHFISCSNRSDSAWFFSAYILNDNMFVVNGIKEAVAILSGLEEKLT